MAQYNVTVIGSGPGGYIAAIRCAQLGMKVAIIERYATLGGTCLNVGCIPSKALLDSSEHFFNATHTFKTHGIDIKGVAVNWEQMINRKAGVVKDNVNGVAFLMKKNKIDVFFGYGSFITKNKIAVKKDDGTITEIDTDNVIIATGSKPSTLPSITIDKQRIITSTEALALPELPKTMVVIGGGVIGCELASVYARLGTQVQIVEYADSLIPTMDKDLGKELQKSLKATGIECFLGYKVKGATAKGKSVTVTADNPAGEEQTFKADYCLVAVGRRAFTDGLELDKAGLKADERGRVPVNEHLQTSVPNIYAIGDVVRGAMLAHKAEEEGVFVAETIAGQKPHINYNLIPGVVYTWPEVAGVGATEQELIAQNIPYKKGVFPFKANGRARASMDTEGFVKILAHKDTDEILGFHAIGARIADIVAEAVVAMEFRASAEDIGRTSHAHPTFTEAVKEACLIASGLGALNM